MIPGSQPQSVSKKTLSTATHPRSFTANGGNIIDSICNQDMLIYAIMQTGDGIIYLLLQFVNLFVFYS